ncbi:MAG TPA: transposase [Burkholderiales bacterium]|nr:transposase [Burkholderiales bacterium]
MYRYRLHPTPSQAAAMHETLERLRELYNAALEEWRDAYRKQGIRVTKKMQDHQLKELREVRPEYAGIHAHLLQDAITRLEAARQGFFKRVKAGDKPGYPRFRGKGRYRTFTFKDAAKRNGVRFVAGGRRLYMHGVGNVRIRVHRPLQGTLKQVSVTLGGDGHWYAAMVCTDVPSRPLETTGQSTGVDLGITAFATLSSGEEIDSPRPYLSAQRKLRRAQQAVSRKRNKRSSRRRKAVQRLAKQHGKVERVRRHFHHHTAKKLVERFDSIAVEALNIKGLAGGMLAKHVHDAGWAQFVSILADKAECAGRELIKVDPRGTSQECSRCGALVPKTLAVRIHACPACGLLIGRDHNSALVVEGRGRRLRGGLGKGRPAEARSPCLA